MLCHRQVLTKREEPDIFKMIPSVYIALTAYASLTTATNRIFGDLGNTACQTCLAQVEAACKGPITSAQFNDCFCDADGEAWAGLDDCLTTETDCQRTRESVLGYYGAHCFAHKDDAEEEFCVDASQDDLLKMSVADSFCKEFITLSTTTSPSARITEASSSEPPVESETTTSEPESTSTTARETSDESTTTQESPTSTTSASGSAATKSNNEDSVGQGSDTGNDNEDHNDGEDESNGASSLVSSMGVSGLVTMVL
ncbi:hypothetical protein QQX98_001503 [Neonectria punicea]|uniref:Extracellular membrane protein CFEM domain-containing protein n=1 Tax=Neonectria punicea TaxID=979145 RepID=A0ABR1HNB3_9HYPO